VRLEKSAHVDSEIAHESFSAEEGARITGALKYSSEPMSLDMKPVPLN
jgi:cytoskeletal protein CcmA (bactofilin family)